MRSRNVFERVADGIALNSNSSAAERRGGGGAISREFICASLVRERIIYSLVSSATASLLVRSCHSAREIGVETAQHSDIALCYFTNFVALTRVLR